MSRQLVDLGQPAPVSKRGATPTSPAGQGGFRCQRPTCMAGATARQLPTPPFRDDFGKRIHEAICADCWTDWVRNYSIKVINELRLDLSTEHGQTEYNRYMREFLGLE
jgi:Fe-S cluster biosynthesis and repair protein YggX